MIRNKVLMRVLALFVVSILILALAACGQTQKDTGTENKDTTAVASTQETTQQETAPNVKITLWGKPNSDAPAWAKEYWDYAVQSYKTKYPNVEIEDLSVAPGADWKQQYDKSLMAGDAPTVYSGFSYSDVQTRAKNGMAADITEFVNNWDLKKAGKVYSTFDDALQVNGKWYAIPSSPFVYSICYNKATVQAGGGDINNLPKTWDEFAALGQKITDKSIPRFGNIMVGMEWCAWAFTPWVWSAGGEMVRANGDGTYKIAFNEDPAVDAAMFWHDMVWKYNMTQKDVLEDFGTVVEDLTSGRGAFGWGDATWFQGPAKEKYGAKDDNFGTMGVPVKDSSISTPAAIAGCDVYVFDPKANKDQLQAAWNFAQMFTYDEKVTMGIYKIIAKANSLDSRPCARLDLTEKKYALTNWSDSLRKEFAQISKYAKPEPFCNNWNDLKNAIVKPLQTILLGEKLTREDVKKILTDCAEDLYKKYPESFKK